MISRNGKDNFFTAHYDWIVLGVGALALVGAVAFYVVSIGDDPDEAVSRAVSEVEKAKPAEIGVESVDMTAFSAATNLVLSPLKLATIQEKYESFLASERRVKCSKCGEVLRGDVKAMPKCPACGTPQEAEKVVVLDADGDGIPDEWEKANGLSSSDPADASLDSDGDGFTNLEEYLAKPKTNPQDPKDHPDYLDSVKIQLPLKETYMPFIFLEARPVGKSWRCEFFSPTGKDDYGHAGCPFTAMVGDEIIQRTISTNKAHSGFVLKEYVKKSDKRARDGMNAMISVDVSEAVVERKSDGKVVRLVKAEGKRTKPAPVDVQATLLYERGSVRTFEVVPGMEIDLSGSKYRIVSVKAVGKGAEVVVENAISGKKTTIKALE
jgi:hypothetical protein